MNLPNHISLFRIILCPIFFTALVSYREGAEVYRLVAVGLFVLAGASDALDGFIARHFHHETKLGRLLDPLADKLLLVSGFIGLLYVDALIYRPPLWVTVTIVFRDLVLVSGMIVIFFVTGNLSVRPNMLGKVTTAFQMGTLFAILLEVAVSVPLYYATAGLTILSGLIYIVREVGLLKNNGIA